VINHDTICCSISVAKIFRTVASFMSQCIFMTGYALIILTFRPMMSNFSTKGTSWLKSSSGATVYWEGFSRHSDGRCPGVLL